VFAVLYLMFGVPPFLGTYLLLYRYLTRDGTSAIWVLLPLGVVALLVLRALFVVRNDVHPLGAADTFAALIVGLWLASIAGWIEMVVVACVRWSSQREGRRHPSRR
jgi:uncharacterized integral membrane protein